MRNKFKMTLIGLALATIGANVQASQTESFKPSSIVSVYNDTDLMIDIRLNDVNGKDFRNCNKHDGSTGHYAKNCIKNSQSVALPPHSSTKIALETAVANDDTKTHYGVVEFAISRYSANPFESVNAVFIPAKATKNGAYVVSSFKGMLELAQAATTSYGIGSFPKYTVSVVRNDTLENNFNEVGIIISPVNH